MFLPSGVFSADKCRWPGQRFEASALLWFTLVNANSREVEGRNIYKCGVHWRCRGSGALDSVLGRSHEIWKPRHAADGTRLSAV